MTHYCHFHPNSTAKWRCAQCQRHYDNACLIQFNEKLLQANCPECTKPLIYTAKPGHTPEMLLSPKTALQSSFKKNHLIMMLSLTLLSGLLTLIDLSLELKLALAILFSGVVCLHIVRKEIYLGHHYQQLRRRHKDEALDHLSVPTSLMLVLFCGLILALPLVGFYKLNWLFGLSLTLLGSLSLPLLFLFSMHSQAQHQVPFQDIFKSLRAQLPALCLLSMLGFVALWVSSELLLVLLPELVSLPLSTLLVSLYFIFLLNLSSKLFSQGLIQLHALRLNSEPEMKTVSSLHDKAKSNALNINLDMSLKNGDYLKAISLLEEELKRNSSSILRRQQLFQLLITLEDHTKLERYAVLFLYWMIERNRTKEASQFIYLLRKNNPDFLIHDLKLMAQLAKLFVQAKKFALVVWLSEEAKTRFKPSEDLASLYISGAQALLTHYKDLSQAEAYLLYVLQTCREFPSAETAKALLMHIQNNLKNQRDIFKK